MRENRDGYHRGKSHKTLGKGLIGKLPMIRVLNALGECDLRWKENFTFLGLEIFECSGDKVASKSIL